MSTGIRLVEAAGVDVLGCPRCEARGRLCDECRRIEEGRAK